MRAATLLLLSAFLLPVNIPSATRTTVYDCEGDACSSVTLTWEEDGQRFKADNNSDRAVKVEVNTYAGKSGVHVEPRSSDYLEVKTFNGPYHADYE
jgi:hypothetical protein